MTNKVKRPDTHALDEGFKNFKPTMRAIATRDHPLPADLRAALKTANRK
jgi:hypothetical protein